MFYEAAAPSFENKHKLTATAANKTNWKQKKYTELNYSFPYTRPLQFYSM